MPKLIENHLLGSIRDTRDARPSRGALLESMMIFTAIEVCGSFLTGNTGPGTTETNFKKFWGSEYMPSKYHNFGELLYKIYRNGVSHSFVAKGGVIPTEATEDIDNHLHLTDHGIYIYVPLLGEDIKSGMKKLLEDIKKNKNDLQKKYCDVLKKIYDCGMNEYGQFIKKYSLKTLKIKLDGDIESDIPC